MKFEQNFASCKILLKISLQNFAEIDFATQKFAFRSFLVTRHALWYLYEVSSIFLSNGLVRTRRTLTTLTWGLHILRCSPPPPWTIGSQRSAKKQTKVSFWISQIFSLKDDKSTKHWLALLLKNLDMMTSGSQPASGQPPMQPGNGKSERPVGKLPGGLWNQNQRHISFCLSLWQPFV